MAAADNRAEYIGKDYPFDGTEKTEQECVIKLHKSGYLKYLKEKVNSNDPNDKAAGAYVFGDLAAKVKKSGSSFLLPLLPNIIKMVGDKKGAQKKLAAVSAKKFAKYISEHVVDTIIPTLLERAQKTTKWPEAVLCLDLLGVFSEVAPDTVAHNMVKIVPLVAELMWSTKKQTAAAASKCMTACCNSIENVDLEPFIPSLVDVIANPEGVTECVHELASTTFVSTVDSSTLAVMHPLLERGLREKKVSTLRQVAVIIENMAKLVKEPKEVLPFMPTLEPALKKVSENVAEPECRARTTAAHKALCDIAEGAAGYVEDTADHVPEVSKIVQAAIANNGFKAGSLDAATTTEVVEYAAKIAIGLAHINEEDFDFDDWKDELVPALCVFDEVDALAAIKEIQPKAMKLVSGANSDEEEVDSEDSIEDLCNCTFSLAYGSKILLNSAKLRLKRGKRYAIIAAKSAGKTTLLKAIANGQVNGFPTEADGLKSIFVETDISSEHAKLNIVDWVVETVNMPGITSEIVVNTLLSYEFTKQMIGMPITSLSGGWRMKLALARAMLQEADILLLDEPTNHLDKANVRWVEDYLTGEKCKDVTSMIVSHDSGFINNVCTNIIHFTKQLKLDTYNHSLDQFVEKHPEAKSYFELGNTPLVFNFPKPGPLEGVNNRAKPVMTMGNVEFTYPGAPTPQLKQVNVKVALASRVACVGANGAGKSTMIKLLTGELKASAGNVYRHPNLKFAYVAQHAFHHIHQHLSKTPNEYIRWRYQDGVDKEEEAKTTSQISKEEKEIMEKPWEVIWEDEDGKKHKEKRVVEKLMGRRKEKKELLYEVKWRHKSQDANTWYSRELLIERGFKKLVEELDRRKLAAEGAFARPVTHKNVEEHLGQVGLEAELASHSRISTLSGGQKVKVVLAAATWSCPHVIILDEPTNYLDRDSLGALGNAIKAFEGGIVLITHNQQFADYTCEQTWVVANNTCDIRGDADWEAYAKEAVELGLDQTDMLDAMGNKVSVKKKKSPDSLKPREKKKLKKEIKKKIDKDEPLTEFEEACADAWELWAGE